MGNVGMGDDTEVPTKKRKSAPVWVPIVVGLAALLLGTGIGGAGSKSEIAELRVSEETLTANVAELEVTEAAAVEDLSKAVEQQAVVEEKLDSRESEIKKLKEEAEKQRKLIVELETELEAARAATAEAEAALANSPASFAAAPPPEASSQNDSVYYKNCTAARAAGAAPVYEGSPGYGRHLDRDGDGVGCE